jgi:hypothetical protein
MLLRAAVANRLTAPNALLSVGVASDRTATIGTTKGCRSALGVNDTPRHDHLAFPGGRHAFYCALPNRDSESEEPGKAGILTGEADIAHAMFPVPPRFGGLRERIIRKRRAGVFHRAHATAAPSQDLPAHHAAAPRSRTPGRTLGPPKGRVFGGNPTRRKSYNNGGKR